MEAWYKGQKREVRSNRSHCRPGTFINTTTSGCSTSSRAHGGRGRHSRGRGVTRGTAGRGNLGECHLGRRGVTTLIMITPSNWMLYWWNKTWLYMASRLRPCSIIFQINVRSYVDRAPWWGFLVTSDNRPPPQWMIYTTDVKHNIYLMWSLPIYMYIIYLHNYNRCLTLINIFIEY